MKKIFATFLTIAAFATITTISSCAKEEDKCEDVTCQNGGTCTDGTCACTTGYEGTNCEAKTRTKYLGSYTASETKNGGAAYSYSGSIDTSAVSISTISINRIPNGTGFFNTNVKATVNGTAITIASQNPDGDAYAIAGTGTYSAGTPATITFTYTVTGPNNAIPPVTVTDNYSATWTKQ